jgi:hypothetical protein
VFRPGETTAIPPGQFHFPKEDAATPCTSSSNRAMSFAVEGKAPLAGRSAATAGVDARGRLGIRGLPMMLSVGRKLVEESLTYDALRWAEARDRYVGDRTPLELFLSGFRALASQSSIIDSVRIALRCQFLPLSWQRP